MTIVGVDLSTFRIDLAWLDASGRPQRWHQVIGTDKDDAIDRMRRIAIEWPGGGQDITEVCIEWPWGRGKALPPLMAVTGIITRAAPPWARVSWVKSGDLRAAIGARNTKLAAHQALFDIAEAAGWLGRVDGWDEHEADALVACVAWTRIIDQQEAAA